MSLLSSLNCAGAGGEGLMGAVEHLKTLCCLGLKPESAMIAVTPLLHEIIPHGWARIMMLKPDATPVGGFSEHPETVAILRERLWTFAKDPWSPTSITFGPAFRAVGIGWLLHLQGRGWLESRHYREIEAPLDACWILDAMLGDGGRSTAAINLTRPRSARPFTVDDVQRLDRLRPWLAHAFQRSNSRNARQEDETPISAAGAPVRSGQMIFTPDSKLIFQTPGLEQRLRIYMEEPFHFTRNVPVRDRLPAPILKLVRQIIGAANGTSNTPPRMRISTAYGVLTLEAKWLLSAGTLPVDAARDPKTCLIAVTMELHEHPVAHAARVLRESGATPTQVKVGIQLALGKPKAVIADELGVQLSSVADLTKRLYKALDVHNSTELGTKIWLGQKQDEPQQISRRAG
jgi:DNA-binding CsgD family transcriptional regulator